MVSARDENNGDDYGEIDDEHSIDNRITMRLRLSGTLLSSCASTCILTLLHRLFAASTIQSSNILSSLLDLSVMPHSFLEWSNEFLISSIIFLTEAVISGKAPSKFYPMSSIPNTMAS
jgi:hypothetical protein